MLSRIIVLTFTLVFAHYSQAPYARATDVENSSESKSEKIAKILDVLSSNGILKSTLIENLKNKLEAATDHYLDVELYAELIKNKKWSEDDLSMVVSHLLDTPAESFGPLCSALQKITTSKPLMRPIFFGSSVRGWDAVSCLKLFDTLKKIPLEHMSEAVDFISAISASQVWQVEEYQAVIGSVAKIDPERMKDVFYEIKQSLGRNGNIGRAETSKKLDFLRHSDNINYSEIIPYFESTSKDVRRLIAEISKYVVSDKKHPLEHQAYVRIHALKNPSKQVLESFVMVLNQPFLNKTTMDSTGVLMLFEKVKMVSPDKLDVMLSFIDKLRGDLDVNCNQLIHLCHHLNQYSEAKIERFIDVLLPQVLQRPTGLNQRVKVIKDLIEAAPYTFSVLSIWAGADIPVRNSEERTLTFDSYRKVMGRLKHNTVERNEAIARAGVKVLETGAKLNESDLGLLVETLNRLPTTMFVPMIDLAVLANTGTECRDGPYLVHTLKALCEPVVSIERIRFVCEILSRHKLLTYDEKFKRPGAKGIIVPGNDIVVMPEWRGVFSVLELLDATRFMPNDQIEDFLTDAIKMWNRDLNSFRHKYENKVKYLKAHVNQLRRLAFKGDDMHLQALFNTWHKILLSGDEADARTVMKVILRKNDIMMLFGENLRALSVLTSRNLDDNSDNNPYRIFEGMKKRKAKPIDWWLGDGKQIPEAWIRVKNSNGQKLFVSIRVSPEAIYRFSSGLRPDLTTTPQVTTEMYVNMLLKLNDRVDAGSMSANWDVVELKRLISDSSNSDSHMQVLLTQDSSSMPAVYLKCIVDHYHSMPDGDEKWDGLAGLLSSVRGCYPGQESAIEKLYFLLAPKMKNTLSLRHDMQDRYLPIYQIVDRALQKFCLKQFSESSKFMRAICELDDDRQMHEPSHQLAAMMGLIGDYVGNSYKLKFDPHAGALYPYIRYASCQNLLTSYYSFFNVKEFMKTMKCGINEELCAPENDHKGLSAKLYDLLEGDAEDSLRMKYDNDDDTIGKFDGLTSFGVANLLNKIEIFENCPW